MSLIVTNLSLSFDNKPIFNNVSFSLSQGQIACLLGHSGCGKTSILRCLLGFETPHTGTISLLGQTLFDNNTHVLPHKRQIGMVFQDYALFSHLTVLDNICFGIKHLSKSERLTRTTELLALIDMKEYATRYPHELSGGQQQRIALARALAPRPQLILLDEPFSNLDVDLRASLSKEIRQLLKKENISAIMVTHDQTEAFAMADMVGVMADNTLQQWDTPMGLYQRPSTKTVAKFIGEGVLLDVFTFTQNGVNTAFGNIACPNTPINISPNTAQVLVRPHHVSLHPSSTQYTQAIITDKEFKGSHWLYQLSCQDTQLLAQTPLECDYAITETVGVNITQGWLV